MIAFTLCSNNYLPKARILAESLRRHNPTVHFVLGLVDEPGRDIAYDDTFPGCEILPVKVIGIPDFAQMVHRYDLVDLNTAVKAFYFRHIFERHGSWENLKVCYFDPDICVYASLRPVEDALDRAAVLLTPHALSPVPRDGKHPREEAFLRYGLYNLGFCGLRRSPETTKLLDWWSHHLVADCRYDATAGLFVDQAWMDLVPIFFRDVEISRHPGLNAAYWNLHERTLRLSEGIWQVNNEWPLVFYHFSDFDQSAPETITRTPTRFSLRDREDLRPLFHEYRAKLAEYDTGFRSIPCVYTLERTESLRKERRAYYRAHPFKWLVAALRHATPKPLKTLLRTA